jgi:amidase
MSGDRELIAATGCEAVALLKSGAATPHDLLDALERRIEAVEPAIHALPTLCFERARRAADALLARPPAERGRLAGLPVPIKDLTEVAGVRTTYGSPIFRDFVPATSNILVEHLEAEGAIVYAKSNTPEFGAGASTFNEVFETTRNPWDTAKSVAGSSGGAAAAIASGTAWLAHGSDMGGSLRNPASFCGIVGLRPTPGRVARSPGFQMFDSLSVNGPMGRNVEDVALLLDAMAGDHPRDPISSPRPATGFLDAARAGRRPVKVAYSDDLGGITPVDQEVAAVCCRAANRFSELGVVVEEAHPDFTGVQEVFHTLRALNFVVTKAHLLRDHRDLLKPELVWNIEKGLALTPEKIIAAETGRWALFQRAANFFDDYDLLLTPATIVPPFPAEQRYVETCAGHDFDTYVDWLTIAYAITVVASPALSLPCGFTAAGLPVGLQIAARPHGEAGLLSAARLLEQVLDLTPRAPIDPRGSGATDG